MDELERFHLQILRSNFPIQQMNISDTTKTKMDSLTRIYPKLLDANYYRYLLDKASNLDSVICKYTTTKMKISTSKFNEILSTINTSGYWNLPLHVECGSNYLDGFGFALEVNTAKKYNYVSLSNCPEKAMEFSKACQKIIDASNLGNQIRVVPKN